MWRRRFQVCLYQIGEESTEGCEFRNIVRLGDDDNDDFDKEMETIPNTENQPFVEVTIADLVQFVGRTWVEI